MRNDIKAVTLATWLQLWRQKSWLQGVLISLLFLALMLALKSHSLQQGGTLSEVMHTVLSIPLFVAFTFAAGLVAEQKDRGMLPLVLTRPVLSFSYLLGCSLGVCVLFTAMMGGLCAVWLALAVYLHVPVYAADALAVCVSWLRGLAYVIGTVALGAHLSRTWTLLVGTMLTATTAVVPLLLTVAASPEAHMLACAIGYLMPYQASPKAYAHLIVQHEVIASQAGWLLAAGVDHVLYSVFMLALSAYLFDHRRAVLMAKS